MHRNDGPDGRVTPQCAAKARSEGEEGEKRWTRERTYATCTLGTQVQTNSRFVEFSHILRRRKLVKPAAPLFFFAFRFAWSPTGAFPQMALARLSHRELSDFAARERVLRLEMASARIRCQLLPSRPNWQLRQLTRQRGKDASKRDRLLNRCSQRYSISSAECHTKGSLNARPIMPIYARFGGGSSTKRPSVGVCFLRADSRLSYDLSPAAIARRCASPQPQWRHRHGLLQTMAPLTLASLDRRALSDAFESTRTHSLAPGGERCSGRTKRPSANARFPICGFPRQQPLQQLTESVGERAASVIRC